MLFALLTACGRQENKKVEEKSETQEEDSEWTGLNSPERAQEILDAGNNPNGEGSFHVHSASSYIASGDYEAADGMVFAYDEEHTEWYMSEELD